MGRSNIHEDAVPFTSENQPKNRGRKKGSKNRSTVLKKWLSVKREIKAEENPKGEIVKGTVEDEIVLALIQKAAGGDVAAIKEIQDTMYGKLAQGLKFDFSELSDEDLEVVESILAKLIGR
jgi:hypothetical protein